MTVQTRVLLPVVVMATVALMDGRIWVEWERGRGSTFFVALEPNQAGAGEGGTST